MDTFELIIAGAVIGFLSVVGLYTIARVVTSAYYRSKSDYERNKK